MNLFGMYWTEQDAKDFLRALAAGILTALMISYVLRRGLGAKV